ncbi:ATP-binding protein, partial [Bifidobacterium dentium]|nr:ATP-binding protein [Bifidobacterium dentium]
MSEATETVEGGRRGGRTVSKSTPDEVMGLACGLPLTRSVLRSVVADATPGQLGVLADLFRAENASRTQSRRAR